MPFVNIWTLPQWHPPHSPGEDTPKQAIVAHLSDDMPELVVANAVALNLDPKNTPLEGVQINFLQLHPRGRNCPDVGIFVLFTEAPPSEEVQLAVKDELKRIIYAWLDEHGYNIPNLAVDAFWGPGHGFLRFGTLEIDW